LFTVTELANAPGVSPSEGKNMKGPLLVTLLAHVAVSVAQAHDDRTFPSQANADVASDFANTSATTAPPRFSDALLWPSAEPRVANASSFAGPAEAFPAAPEPKFGRSKRDDFRWQLALGITVVTFRSSLYSATGVGTSTSLTYFTNEWLGVEGSVNTAFASTIYQNEHVKYLSYGAGPRIASRFRKWEPWAHTIIGGVHVLPQTADNSKNGFGVQVGGGVDYRIFPHVSARLELDWVRTHLFGQWQNSAQANADIVLHF
jgi:opacity protein-like surface antigen